MLQTTTVEEHTLVLLKKLQESPLFSRMRLVGGTALALQLGHRFSIDLDFFGTTEATIADIVSEFCLPDFNIIVQQDTKAIKLLYINNVKVDIVNYPYKWLEPAIETEGVRMAGMKDISAMKLSAVTNRGTRKDFVDIYFLLQHYSLREMIGFYEQKYPENSSLMALRSLTYFEDAEEQPLPRVYSELNWDTVKHTIQEEVRKY